MILHRCADQADAELWAGACQSVLRALGIAAWWRIRVDPADAGALLVAVDYEPRGGQPW